MCVFILIKIEQFHTCQLGLFPFLQSNNLQKIDFLNFAIK